MNVLRLAPPALMAVLMLSASCRSADSLFKRAIEKGLKIDTARKVVLDTIRMPGAIDTIAAQVDTSAILALCKELISPSNGAKPKPLKVIIPKLQDEICPDIDTTYRVAVAYRDTVVYFTQRLQAKGGQIILDRSKFTLPVFEEQTQTTIRPGISNLRAWVMSGISCIFGAVIALLAFFWKNWKYRKPPDTA